MLVCDASTHNIAGGSNKGTIAYAVQRNWRKIGLFYNSGYIFGWMNHWYQKYIASN